jgi:hypothetical protein
VVSLLRSFAGESYASREDCLKNIVILLQKNQNDTKSWRRPRSFHFFPMALGWGKKKGSFLSNLLAGYAGEGGASACVFAAFAVREDCLKNALVLFLKNKTSKPGWRLLSLHIFPLALGCGKKRAAVFKQSSRRPRSAEA